VQTYKVYSRGRVLRIYAAAVRVLVSYLGLRLQRPFLPSSVYGARLVRAHGRNARRIERAIISAGGLFIKAGQMISILSNFLPEEFRRELAGLQDQLPPRPYAEIALRIETELGRPADGAAVLAETLSAFAGWFAGLSRGDSYNLLTRWRELAPSARGVPLEWDTPNGVVAGVSAGLADDGALLVRVNDRIERIISGELRWK